MSRIIILAISGLAATAAVALGLSFGTKISRGTAEPPPAPPPPETFAAVFQPCAHCHQIGAGARDTSGPALTGILDQPAARGDYPYSPALREADLVWDAATLAAFLDSPAQLVPGTRMIFAGLPPEEISAIIAFLADPKPDP